MFSQHPRGLFICFATELWSGSAITACVRLLIFYLMQHFLFSEQESYPDLRRLHRAGLHDSTSLGGAIADRYLGARKAVTLGAVLLVMGHFGIAFEASVQIFYLSLALIIVGVGFLKTNASTLVGAVVPTR